MIGLERGLGVRKPAIPYSSREDVPQVYDFSAVRESGGSLNQMMGLCKLRSKGETLPLAGEVYSYATKVAEFFARRMHGRTVPNDGNRGYLQEKYVKLDDLLDARDQLREKGVSERLIEGANLSAMAAVLESFAGEVAEELRNR